MKTARIDLFADEDVGVPHWSRYPRRFACPKCEKPFDLRIIFASTNHPNFNNDTPSEMLECACGHKWTFAIHSAKHRVVFDGVPQTHRGDIINGPEGDPPSEVTVWRQWEWCPRCGDRIEQGDEIVCRSVAYPQCGFRARRAAA